MADIREAGLTGPSDILKLLPEERPLQFEQLPDDEKQWRGRYFLMVYSMDASEEFAWANALDNDVIAIADVKDLVSRTPDYQIVEALALRNADNRPTLPAGVH